MRIEPQNNGFEMNEAFGLFPARLAYLAGGREAGPEHLTKAKPVEEADKDYKAAEQELAKERVRLLGEIQKYNKKYASDTRFDKEKEPQKEPVTVDPEFYNLDATIGQIDRILTTTYKEKDQMKTLSAEPMGDQAKELLALRDQLTDSDKISGGYMTNDKFIDEQWNAFSNDKIDLKIDQITNPEQKIVALEKIARNMQGSIYAMPAENKKLPALMGVLSKVYLQISLLESDVKNSYKQKTGQLDGKTETIAREHGKGLLENIRTIDKMIEQKAGWEKSPYYDEYKAAFDHAKGDSEFAGLFEVPETGLSTQKQSESEFLFFSIIAEKTDNFKKDFIFGDEFGQNTEENKKRFPFIYNEWLKEKGSTPESAEIYEAQVNQAKGILKQKHLQEDVREYLKAIPAAYTKSIAQYIQKIDTLDTLHDDEKWDELQTQINNIIAKFKQEIRNEETPNGEKAALEKHVDDLGAYKDFASAQYESIVMAKKQTGVDISFTRANLSHPANRQLLLEIAMKQYMKAMKIVDSPFGKDERRPLYHPMVRRLLIASIYDEGVSESRLDKDGKNVYVENTNADNYWMLAELGKSEYFNTTEVGKNLDERHRGLLLVARLANKVANNLNIVKYTETFLQDLVANYTDQTKLSKYPKRLVDLYGKKTPEELGQIQGLVRNDKKLMGDFLESSKKALQDPLSPESDKFVQKILKNEYNVKLGHQYGDNSEIAMVISKEDFQRSENFLHKVEFNDRAFELQDKSRMQYFERLGMRIEGLYEGYTIELAKNPEMNVANWDALLLSKDDAKFNKLYNFLDRILPESNMKGKEDFMAVFKGLKGYRGSLDPESKDDQSGAVAIYTMIKLQLQHAERVKAAEERGDTKTLAQLNGMTVGDKVSEYVKGVWDMAFGPGQSWANRGAGLVMLFGALKMAKKAWKGEGAWGNAFRVLFIAGAAELGMKHITGRGLLERAGFETAAEAIEGTRKAVLVQKGKEYMDKQGITKEQHVAALYELDKVPFKTVMDWYNSSNKDDGKPISGQPDIFKKMNINVDMIIKAKATWDPQNAEIEARRIVMFTVRHFFEYVGTKDDKDENYGAKMLTERWGRMLDPKFRPEYSEFSLGKSVIEKYQQNPNQLTWKVVMENEIDLHHVDETVGENGAQLAYDTMGRYGEKVVRWGRKDVYGPLAGYFEVFAQKAGIKAEELKGLIGEAGDAFGSNLHRTEESVSFWWENNKYEIRRIAGEHAELVVEGIKLPFEVIYSVDRAAIPWTLKGLRVIKEDARRQEFTQISGSLDFKHILPVKPDGTIDAEVLRGDSFTDQTKNRPFAQFGYFQESFLGAFKAGEQKDGKFTKEAYYEQKIDNKPETGYFITETSLEDLGMARNEKNVDINNIYNQLEIKAYDKAVEKFQQESHLTKEQVREYLYPIHVIRASDPYQLYVFWRMPLVTGIEFNLKANGQWADYMNPNYYKHRLPFMVDPSKSFTDNLFEAFSKSVDPEVRVFAGDVGSWAAQLPRFILGAIQRGGDLIHWAVNIKNKGKERAPWAIDMFKRPEWEQGLDEFMTSARGGKGMAVSDFYHEQENADAYDVMLGYARKTNSALYLGIFDANWNKDYMSDAYKTIPKDFSWVEVGKYYQTWKAENRRAIGTKFETTLAKKITEEGRPVQTAKKK